MKKILSFMAALVMVAASMSAQDLVIVHFNDTHSHLDNVKNTPDERFFHMLEKVRARYVLP